METLWQDIRYGIRMLAKRPGFAAVTVLALALGIGANSAIFSVVNAVLLRPLPFEDPERLVMVWERRPRQNREAGPVAPADFVDWQNQNQVFERMAAYSPAAFNLTGVGEPEQIITHVVTTGFFQVLGVEAAVGRTFLQEVDDPTRERTVVLSQGFWQRRLGGDPNVTGKVLTLDDESYTVIGVMPSDFQFPDSLTQMWVAPKRVLPETSLPGNPDPAMLRGMHYLSVIARLKQGVTLEQSQAEMQTIAGRLEQQYPNENTGHTARVVSLHEQLIGDVRPALLVLLGAVGFVLLIACANVANLLLARATARHREMSIRNALGASRLRLIRQLLTESTLLSLTGGVIGLLLAMWGVDLLIALSPENLPRLREIGLDGRVVGFTLVVSILTGIIFGLAPALQASKLDLNSSLKEGGRGSMEGFGRQRMRGLLIISEVALALVLLIGAGLMIRSFQRMHQVDPGFDPNHVLALQLSLPRSKYTENEQMVNFYNQVLGRIATLPGVESVGATWTLPLSGQDAGRGFEIEGYTPAPDERTNAAFGVVSPRYFQTMKIPVLKGREFADQDTASAPGVVIINEPFARRYFPDGDALGKRLKLRGDDNPWLTIAGVVRDIKHTELTARPRMEMYLPYLQYPFPSMNVVVRTAHDPASLMMAVRKEVWAVDPDQPVANVETMTQLISNSVARARFNTILLGIFASVALILAAIGLYGVISYSVTQRTHEIGIRLALGAQHGDVLRMIVGQGMILVLVGVLIGLAAAFAVTRLMSSLLYGVTATDPLTFAGVSLVLAGVAFLASLIPARRATKVDPMAALRYE
ncbi:MAG TPA: ABC transporter permease [Pyrinomonadaceae bacterium]|nr:ABC transporter permease [Pyrinomonadaceae bacterium]